MKSIRLCNFRSFSDTDTVEIKPLTFLVGANSSGKSSFLRFFPLLKQSVENRAHGSFLWYGNHVDFRDFKNTVKDGENKISVEFTFDNFYYPFRSVKDKNKNEQITLRLECEASEDNFDRISKFEIIFKHFSYIISDDVIMVKTAHVTISSVDLDDKISRFSSSDYLPEYLFAHNDNIYSSTSRKAEEEIREIIKRYNPNADTSYLRFPSYILFSTVSGLKSYLSSTFNINIPLAEIRRLNALICYHNYFSVAESVNKFLKDIGHCISYIGPLRKTTERYSRFQNIDISEISPDGENLPVFLNTLPKNRFDSLNRWLEKFFFFKIIMHAEGGHIELRISEQGKEARNMIDKGFGYTQLLPIIINIWKIVEIDSHNYTVFPYGSKKSYIIAIEQPELHLHPRLQAYFAKMLVYATKMQKEKKYDIRFIIETHSPTIINTLGVAVSEEEISADDISVLLFEHDYGSSSTEIQRAFFDSEGYLNNWPLGFLSGYVD